jgi:hypothetical protein
VTDRAVAYAWFSRGRLDQEHVRHAALVRAVLGKVVYMPVVIKIGFNCIHGGLDWRVAVQRGRDAIVGIADVVLREDRQRLPAGQLIPTRTSYSSLSVASAVARISAMRSAMTHSMVDDSTCQPSKYLSLLLGARGQWIRR